MKTVSLRRRLAALEKQVTGGAPIILIMRDGGSKTIRGDERDLLSCAMRGERTPEIELIAYSVSSVEPLGSQMVDLARALLNSPTERPERPAESGLD